MEVVRIRTSRRGEIGVLFPSVSSLLCRRCREDGRGSRLLGCSCAAVAGSVSEGRRGKVVVVGAAVRSVLVALMLVVGGEEVENKKGGEEEKRRVWVVVRRILADR
jgi:hypothetical protein